MGTQVSYPGIYIQEFTPGAPIQGVGTSTAAFIGTASMGPVNQPTFITSWDEFQNVFGGFINEAPNLGYAQRSWLAPAVYGFFLNGGTGCYIVRAVKLPAGVTSLNASVNLDDAAANTELVATAIVEGTIGNSISVTVNNSSRLASMLTAAGAGITKLTVPAALSAGQLTFQVTLPASPTTFVLGQALPPGALINISHGGTHEDVTVASSGGNSITLASGLVNAYGAGAQVASLEFDLVVTGATTETWAQLSMNPLHPGYWQSAVKSQMITLSLPSTAPPATPNPNPAAGGPFALTNGTDD